MKIGKYTTTRHKTRKHKTRKHKTRKHKTRKYKTRKYKLRRFGGGDNCYTPYTSSIQWPPYNGCVNNNTEIELTLDKDTIVDRFGNPIKGYFIGDGKTTYDGRSLYQIKPDDDCEAVYKEQVSKNNLTYTVYKILKPFKVKSCEIAPWFGHSGHGIQYRLFENSIDNVDDMDKIELKRDATDGKGLPLPPTKVPHVGELLDLHYIEIMDPSLTTLPNFK